MKRLCDKCSTSLPGPKQHGWPAREGKALFCGYCMFPDRQKYRDAFIQKNFGVVLRSGKAKVSRSSERYGREY